MLVDSILLVHFNKCKSTKMGARVATEAVADGKRQLTVRDIYTEHSKEELDSILQKCIRPETIYHLVKA